jgi:two-component system response regulator FixJ
MTAATVIVVDDDAAVRDSLAALLESSGFKVATHASADAFLAAVRPSGTHCAVFDIRMPGMDGLALQRTLNQRGDPVPVIVVTGHADVTLAVQAMKAGAVDFLEKPYDDEKLLAAIRAALALGRRRARDGAAVSQARERIATLTSREREVFDLVAQGDANKVVAHKLGISERTVEVYRAHVMEKMHAASIADLVRAALAAGA